MAIINLNASYEERLKVKALGARWNPTDKTWYIDDSQDLEAFQQWLPDDYQPTTTEVVTDTAKQKTVASKLPVRWVDSVGRSRWISEYTCIGTLPGFAREAIDAHDEEIVQAIGQSLILSDRSRSRTPNDHSRLVGSLLAKILQRGQLPLPTIALENSAIRENNLVEMFSEFPLDHPDIGFELDRKFKGHLTKQALLLPFLRRAPFLLDDEFEAAPTSNTQLFGSSLEMSFLSEWVPKNLGPEAGHWFIPQASLDRLLEAYGQVYDGDRRVDFLFSFPGAQPLVIEIDGDEHQDDLKNDSLRDSELSKCGIRVIRVPNEELIRGSGEFLSAIKEHCLTALHLAKPPPDADLRLPLVIWDCAIASKIQFAIAKAIQWGWIGSSETWSIKILGVNGTACDAIIDLLSMLAGFDQLYGTDLLPTRTSIKIAGKHKYFARVDEYRFESTEPFSLDGSDNLTISIDYEHGSFHSVSKENDNVDIVIRPAYLPLHLSVESYYPNGRMPISANPKNAKEVLSIFLQQIFRKKAFRPLQAEAIINALMHIDSVILLPTGAGKSIVYQLAGLLMPGITLVVDPIISLIEDQVEGLLNYGIDRAAAVTSFVASEEEQTRLLRGIERGEYHFVLHSPERLQSPVFRSTLRALAESSLVNLAVIDEAHCVSEWGHDFRPAYLNLGRNIRRFGKDRNSISPPIIALTGTASRTVLRDLLTELDIDRSNSAALIRPESFDRKELNFQISKLDRLADSSASFRGILNTLPDRFGLPKEEFYRPCGRNTASGIIFVPFVNGISHSILGTLSDAKSAANQATFYSGKAPKGMEHSWEITKRQNVKAFKSNSAPILVSTKAFGMGIDKPNIRYTIHMGMPASLESFYQEAGRAGRDRRPAQCIVIFSEFDPNRTDQLLDPSLDVGAIRSLFAEQKKSQNDDISRALWFHLQSFSGQENEIKNVERILSDLGSLNGTDSLEIPFWQELNDDKGQEKAIFRLVKLGVISDYEVLYGSKKYKIYTTEFNLCLLYTSPSPRDRTRSRMPSSA